MRSRLLQFLQAGNSCRNAGQRHCHKAAVLEKVGEELEIKKTKLPKMKDDQVKIAVHCCGVNMSDYLYCKGVGEKPKLPFIPGFEISGEVTDVGKKVTTLKTGDRVVGLAKDTFSGFSEQCVISLKDVWKIPQCVSFEKAAALVDSYATAIIAARRANLTSDDTVLVTAAAGGLGLAAVDVAANLFRAKVIGACGTEDKASLVRDKGAFAAINYKKIKINEAVKNIFDGKGPKMIFDAVGGDVFSSCLQCISHEGSIIIAGFASLHIPSIATSELLPKSCALIGVSLSNYRLSAYDIYYNTVQEVIDMCEEELIEPHISAKFKLDKVNEAFRFIEEKQSTGKVILELS